MTGLGAAIARAVERSPVPVIAKETGAGLTREAAIDLAGCGVHALDVGGSAHQLRSCRGVAGRQPSAISLDPSG